MNTASIVRAAAVVSLLFAAGHTVGGLHAWSPPGNTAVLEAMQSFRFDAGGVNRTYWDFYAGFGWIISVFMAGQTIILWQLARIVRKDQEIAGGILATLFASNVVNAVLTWRFFFLVPQVFATIMAALLGLALATAWMPGHAADARRAR